MPKMKTHRGAAKRLRVSGSGKILRAKTGRAHLLQKKSATRKRRLRRPTGIHDSQKQTVRRLLGLKGE